MALGNFWSDTRLCKQTRSHTWILAIFIAVAFILLCNVSFAAEKLPKYQIIPNSDDKAYLDPYLSYSGYRKRAHSHSI
jgi:hypothetical protein